MPTIYGAYQIDISPDKYLDKCSPEELMEIDLLLSTSKYQDRMNIQDAEEHNEVPKSLE